MEGIFFDDNEGFALQVPLFDLGRAGWFSFFRMEKGREADRGDSRIFVCQHDAPRVFFHFSLAEARTRRRVTTPIIGHLSRKCGCRFRTTSPRRFAPGLLRSPHCTLLFVYANVFCIFGLVRSQANSQPKHCYALDNSCSVSDIKEAKAGGRPLYYFELAWPSLSAFKEEAEDEGDADSGRCAYALCTVARLTYRCCFS